MRSGVEEDDEEEEDVSSVVTLRFTLLTSATLYVELIPR